MTLASAVNEYLRRPGDTGFSDAKAVIVRALKSVHEGGDFHTTDYFNHSFIPDIVGSWPTADEDREERLFFLRPHHHVEFIRGDLRRLASLRPSFISLSEGDPDLQEIEDSLDAPVGDVAITNTYALGVLGGQKGRLRRERLAAALFLRRARGIIGEDEAKEVDGAAVGFEAAMGAESAGVVESLNVFAKFLQEDAAAAINRYMYYLWTSATAAAYPGAIPADQWLEREEVVEVLRYLLERGDLENERFWGRLGKQVTLDELESLGEVGPTENLQRLMGFASSELRTRAVHVDRADGQPSLELDTRFLWSIRDRVLQVANHSTVLRVVDDLRRLRGVSEDLQGPTMAELRNRISGYQLIKVALRSTGFEADLRAVSETPAIQQRDLNAVADDIDPTAEVIRATVQPPTVGSPYDCDFRRSIVQAAREAEADEPLANLVLAAASLLANVTDRERYRLREALGLRTVGEEL